MMKLHLVVMCGGSLVLGLVLMHLRIAVRWKVRVREARVRVSGALMHLMLRDGGVMHLRITLRGQAVRWLHLGVGMGREAVRHLRIVLRG